MPKFPIYISQKIHTDSTTSIEPYDKRICILIGNKLIDFSSFDRRMNKDESASCRYFDVKKIMSMSKTDLFNSKEFVGVKEIAYIGKESNISLLQEYNSKE